MMAFSGGAVASGAAAGGLLVLLLLLGLREGNRSRRQGSQPDMPPIDGIEDLSPCPPEFVSKVFSDRDREFISSMGSTQLDSLLLRERKHVALLWVGQTSAVIRRVMRAHAAVARTSQDLEFATELKIVAEFAQLMLICGFLFVVIQLAGPFWLRGLALYADRLCQRMAQATHSLAPEVTSDLHVSR
jgi:hypothetical protein